MKKEMLFTIFYPNNKTIFHFDNVSIKNDKLPVWCFNL